MKKLQNIILILSIIFFTSCKKEVSELEYERDVITEILPVLVDSICVDARKMVPPPRGSYTLENHTNIIIDTSKSTKEEKIEYIKWESNNRKLEKDTSKVIIAFDPIFKKSEPNFKIDITKIKLNNNFKLKNIAEFPKIDELLFYETKFNFVFSGILKVSGIKFDKDKKTGVLEASFSYCGRCGRGYRIYIMESNGKWMIEKMEDTWIS